MISDTLTQISPPVHFYFLHHQEGEKVIEEFLSKISKLDCDALSEEDLEKEVKKLREEARSHNNPYIAHLLPRET